MPSLIWLSTQQKMNQPGPSKRWPTFKSNHGHCPAKKKSRKDLHTSAMAEPKMRPMSSHRIFVRVGTLGEFCSRLACDAEHVHRTNAPSKNMQLRGDDQQQARVNSRVDNITHGLPCQHTVQRSTGGDQHAFLTARERKLHHGLIDHVVSRCPHGLLHHCRKRVWHQATNSKPVKIHE